MNERLAEVARELAEAASAAPGPDGRRRLPVVQPRDAAGLIEMMHAQLDVAIEHRAAAAQARKVTIACHRGCTSCCELPVVVGEAEAVAIVEWLRLPEHAAVRAGFEAAYPAWRAALGGLVEDIAAEHASREAKQAVAAAFHGRHAMCPFNRGGDCTIYPVRPALCRTAHALNTSAKCADDVEQVEYFTFAEVEDTYDGQEGMRHALHLALRDGHRYEVLGKAIRRRLAGPAAGRNDPCVCGSGAKFKKCCGA